MNKIKMVLLVLQIEGLLKGIVHRKGDFMEMKKILDDIRNQIIDEKTGVL